MLINMFKTLFPRISITDLIKYTDTKVVLCTYNNSCIPQLGVCKVSIIHKGFEF